jgi:hypothetical protein
MDKLSKLGKSSEWWQQPVPAADAGSAQAQAAAAAAAAGMVPAGVLSDMQQQQMHRPAATVVSANGLLEFVAGRESLQPFLPNGLQRSSKRCHQLLACIVGLQLCTARLNILAPCCNFSLTLPAHSLCHKVSGRGAAMLTQSSIRSIVHTFWGRYHIHMSVLSTHQMHAQRVVLLN